MNRAPIYIDASKSFDPDIVQGSLVSDILFDSNDVTGFEEPPTFPTLGIDLTNNLCTGGSSSYLECLKFSWNCTVLHRKVFKIFGTSKVVPPRVTENIKKLGKWWANSG